MVTELAVALEGGALRFDRFVVLVREVALCGAATEELGPLLELQVVTEPKGPRVLGGSFPMRTQRGRA